MSDEANELPARLDDSNTNTCSTPQEEDAAVAVLDNSSRLGALFRQASIIAYTAARSSLLVARLLQKSLDQNIVLDMRGATHGFEIREVKLIIVLVWRVSHLEHHMS